MSRIHDPSGTAYALGERIGSGGEGAVYEVLGKPQVVAKLYHQPPSPTKVSKLGAMVAVQDPGLLKVAAWPISLLNHQRTTIGFLLPRIDGRREVHQLYSPAHRKVSFPRADFAFLLRTAVNVCIAIEEVHRVGCVVGDVNQGNVLVGSDAIVSLIDCDSFQVSDESGSVFRCEVGVAHFTPPELQSCRFGDVTRTLQHDYFGLAVLLFHLLMMGRHPFAGIYSGRGDMPIERAISEGRFAFGPKARVRLMAPPPHAAPIAHLGPSFPLFERAFCSTTDRPTAREWRSSLQELERQLVTCSSYGGHRYVRGLGACPWCDLIAAGAPDFFIAATLHTPGGLHTRATFDLKRAWALIEAVPAPPKRRVERPSGAQVRGRPLRAGINVPGPKPIDTSTLTAIGGAVALSGLCFWPMLILAAAVWALAALVNARALGSAEYREELERRRKSLAESEGAWARVAHECNRVLEKAEREWRAAMDDLEGAKREYQSIDSKCQRELDNLRRGLQEAQRRAFLDAYFIEDAGIPGIGPVRVASLASFGIETAADIDERIVLAVPGFGSALTGRLVAWRAKLLGGFRFDPSKGVSDMDRRNILAKYQRGRTRLEATLRQGPAQLKVVMSEANAEIQAIRPAFRAADSRLAQAIADLQVVETRR